ncbi:hypothetical protein [Amycolatopsis echigonensis]|uniref:Gram-positive cocci surface proteins LPxTG domain-containing protein n=1 Tax=Amycolatopsis echigonensis TaxID=2576905 RepID=A0A8E1VZW0_9PSEU|nr:hypothetical protein [Amycolatopsis echigonensis]MBB2501276.1 hypothetical protein [Amycolatopsis echigonensis]
MKRTVVFSALVAAGMLSAAPAFAAEAPTTPPATSTAAPSPSTEQPPDGNAGVPKAFIRVLPSSGRAGDRVTVRVGCEASEIKNLNSAALQFGKLHPVGAQNDPSKAPVSQGTATVRAGVKPGSYKVSFSCGSADLATKFTVLGAKPAPKPTPAPAPAPKQVSKVPSGAPQTGGTDGPVTDDQANLGLPIAAGAMGVLALGGTGLVAARRRRRG